MLQKTFFVKKNLWPLFNDGVQLSQDYRTTEETVYLPPLVPSTKITWYSFHKPWKDERLSRPWSHSVVLNPGLLDWESSVLTTRSILQLQIQRFYVQTQIECLAELWDLTSSQDSPGPLQWLTSIKRDCLLTYEVDQVGPWDSQIFLWKLSQYKTLSVYQVSRSKLYFTKY